MLRPVFSLCLLALPLAAQPASDLDVLKRVLTPSSRTFAGRINLQDKTWDDWQRRTGELPPDFSKLPKQPFLPDPFIDVKTGATVKTRAAWAEQRAHIRELYEQWVFGHMPPKPDNLKVTLLSEARHGQVTERRVRLEFGPGLKASLKVVLLIPPGAARRPVFLTNQSLPNGWAAVAVRRGYIAAVYSAMDDDDDSESFLEAYPDYDFSVLARRAWAGQRTVDYLLSLPEVDPARIGITGHSRNGKMALLAAAFDERIAAVSLSSGNTGEGTPWRYSTDWFYNESLEGITGNFPMWFHPRLRFFAGREHQLPVDQNLLLALVAPRGLQLASAYPEGQGAPFGFEQSYRSVKRVYDWLGASAKVGLNLRAAEHPTTAEDINQYVDFFDLVFGRRAGTPPETWIVGYDYDQWLRLSGEKAPAAPPADPLGWLLGDEPPAAPYPAATELRASAPTSDGLFAYLYQRPLQFKGARALALPFGDDLKGDLYVPDTVAAGQRLPVVIWLHPYSHSTGYSRIGRRPIQALLDKGFAVLAFDQIGYGTRIHEARRFYERFPHWSLLGKMVADTRAAVTALRAASVIDPRRIYLSGFALGARVALWTAAAEPAIAAVAMVGGYQPLKLSTASDGSEGVRHFSHLHGLAPRMGFYAGAPASLPADESDVMRRIAPRPVLLISGTLDRYSPVEAVRRSLAGQVNVRLETPEEFARYTPALAEATAAWLAAQASAR